MKREAGRTRVAAARAGLALGLLLLSGCSQKVDLDITVSENDRVSGSLLLALSRQDTSSGVDSANEIEAPDGLPVTSSEPYEDASFQGRTFTFKDVSLATFNDVFGPADEGLVIVRQEDTFRFEGTMDLTDEDPAPADDVPSEILIAITFPGPVTSSNGNIDGARVEWRPALGQNTKILAEAMAVPARTGWGWAAALGMGILALLGITVVVFGIHRRQSQRAPVAELTDPGFRA
jgi:hypothetical protein